MNNDHRFIYNASEDYAGLIGFEFETENGSKKRVLKVSAHRTPEVIEKYGPGKPGLGDFWSKLTKLYNQNEYHFPLGFSALPTGETLLLSELFCQHVGGNSLLRAACGDFIDYGQSSEASEAFFKIDFQPSAFTATRGVAVKLDAVFAGPGPDAHLKHCTPLRYITDLAPDFDALQRENSALDLSDRWQTQRLAVCNIAYCSASNLIQMYRPEFLSERFDVEFFDENTGFWEDFSNWLELPKLTVDITNSEIGQPGGQMFKVRLQREFTGTEPEFAGYGIGVKGRETPGLDIDIRDQVLADSFEAFVQERFGPALCRIGQAPKRLLVFATDKPFEKISSAKFRSPDGQEHQVEWIANGYQWVAMHVHPETKKPYAWPKGDLTNDCIYDLPVITSKQAQELIDEFERQIPSDWTLVARHSPSNLKSDQEELSDEERLFTNIRPKVRESKDDLKLALSGINFDSRPDWINAGMALWHQFDGDDVGFEMWDQWSSQSTKYNSSEMRVKWVGFMCDPAKRAPLTAAWILKYGARIHGTNAAPGASAISGLIGLKLANQIELPTQSSDIIKGLIPQGVTVLYAPSQAAKSFAALDMAFSIATGGRFCERRTKKGAILYCALEGQGGFAKRVLASLQVRDIKGKEVPLGIIGFHVNLATGEGLNQVIEASKELVNLTGQDLKLVIIDTFSQALSGQDENTSAGVTAVLQNVKEIEKELDCSVMLVAHSGKDPSKGIRGHSSLFANADAVLKIDRSADGKRTLALEKSKDGDTDFSWDFLLNPVQLGVDLEEEPIVSCTVDWLGESDKKSRKTLSSIKPTEKAGKVLKILEKLAVESDQTGGIEGLDMENEILVSRNEVKEEAVNSSVLSWKPDKEGVLSDGSCKTFSRVEAKLCSHNIIVRSGNDWIVDVSKF